MIADAKKMWEKMSHVHCWLGYKQFNHYGNQYGRPPPCTYMDLYFPTWTLAESCLIAILNSIVYSQYTKCYTIFTITRKLNQLMMLTNRWMGANMVYTQSIYTLLSHREKQNDETCRKLVVLVLNWDNPVS